MQAALLYQKIWFVKRGLFFASSCLLLGSFFTHQALAADSAAGTVVDEALLTRGYTLRYTSGTAVLGLAPNGVQSPVAMLVVPASGKFPDQQGMTRVSDVWTIDVVHRDPDVSEPLKLSQPLTVGLQAWSHSLFRKRIFFFDRNAQQWKPLRTVNDEAKDMVFAQINIPYAQIAVFEDENAVEGKGSWFYHRYDDTAASNDFPMGSKLKVTDLDTKKSVTVTVRSRGPFVAGRVIDIEKSAFQQLRSAREGIARLRVELVL